MVVFEVVSGGDRRSLIKRFERKSKHDAVCELVDFHLLNCTRIEKLERELEDLRATVAVPTYTTHPGESVMGIALRQLKDEKRWPEICDLNADRFPGMGPHDYYPPGTVLTMPTHPNDKAVCWSDIHNCLDAELREWTGDHRKAVERALTDAAGRIRALLEAAKA